jgi:aspartyl-tRNA(Asn)/glutamyl-tRNA(Gln) amidotransferase subunit B
MSSVYEAVIGLEVHAQMLTRTKAFCSCSTAFGAPPNTQVCATCLGLPGALPVLNAEAVAMAVRTALALDCTIRSRSRFARKNYFYPDLPKGYQISQFDEPFSEHGSMVIDVGGETKTARITRVHMEEDAGKNLHDRGDRSIVDLNRSGVPLVEIVGEPDLRSGVEAAEYLRTLREVLMTLGVNDGNLEEGSFRCDANVSIRRVGQEKLGTRVELKNINSFRFVQKGIEHEIQRQEAVLSAGGTVVQETRGWDEKTGSTFCLRSKEEAQDYRYFPEPDLPELVLTDDFVARQRQSVGELPRAKRKRFVETLSITASASQVLTSHPKIAVFFEEAAKLHGDAGRVANFIQSEVLRDVSTRGLEADLPVSAAQVAALLRLVDQGTLSGKQAKDVYGKMVRTDKAPEVLVAELGLQQVSDVEAIEAVVSGVIAANPKQAEQLRAGKMGLFGFFVGQVMRETKGAANPGMVNGALKRLLEV